MTMTISKRKIVFFIWTFCLIFQPPVMTVAPIVLMGVWSWIYMICNYRRLILNFRFREILILFVVFCFIDIYLCFVSLFSNGYIDQGLGTPIYVCVFGLPSAVAYSLVVDKSHYNLNEVIECIIWAGFVQGCIAVLSLFSYNFQSIFVKKLYYIMDNSVVDYWRTMRLYGWATGMTYSMPIMAGTIGVMAVMYSIKNKNKYFLLSPVIWMAGILNARTSMVIIIVGLFCTFISINYFRHAERRRTGRIILIVLGFILSVSILMRFIGNESLDRWIKNGVSQIYNFILGERTGYFTSIGIVSNTLELPADLITGYGKVGTASDVGYIRDLWLGGIIYSTLIYGSFVFLDYKLLKSLKKFDSRMGKGIFLFFILSFVLVNIKGQIFSANEFTLFFFTMVILFSFYKKVF